MKSQLLTVSAVALAFGVVGCATPSMSGSSGSRTDACNVTPVRNSTAGIRGSGGRLGPSAAVRNPRPEVARGNADDGTGSAAVVAPAGAAGRSDGLQACSLTVAQAADTKVR